MIYKFLRVLAATEKARDDVSSRTAFAALFVVAMFISGCTQQSVAQSADTMKASLLDAACYESSSADQATQEFAKQTCSAYMRGLTDGLFLQNSFSKSGHSGCLPTDHPVSVAQATSELHAYLKEHPGLGNNSAGLVATAAIMDAHRCSVQE